MVASNNNYASNKDSTNTAVALTITSALCGLIATWATLRISNKRHEEEMEAESKEWERRRQEERKGRIRAEQKLRSLLNEKKNAPLKESNDIGNNNDADPYAMRLSTIGTIVSPYTKRMGTPRQGALVPSSRGFVQFNSSLSPEAVDGIAEYSHLWVIFQFHANTSLATSKKTKIRPPRGGGRKVGMLATRSPHRPNALGLSLVIIDRWEPSTRRLYIKALDLVHGTPVYDVKPYVHWDIPGNVYDTSLLKLPDWVENKEDVLPSVEFTDAAEASLLKFVEHNRLAPLYSSKDKTSLEAAKQTLLEILAQDPRTSHKGVSKNQRGSLSGSETYRILFGKIEIEFSVSEHGAKVIAVHPYHAESAGNSENASE
ncbi:unnamed protein product [Cylindrotheca closterium]|uniref:TsaA-like domain-containing protein n=1 Tax=Cylindrotheca closterium TaxID=2856 RepID=A0AAD2PW33_9STRA|nr:unnamed protein product [Cylindrotheca closterium]